MLEQDADWLIDFNEKFSELTLYMVDDLEKCLQCGKCTSQCPAARITSYNPRRLVRDILMGNVERVISSQELWFCFFCGGCYAVCPRDIQIPFAVVMLRYAALARGYGWDNVKEIKDPFAQDYYETGLTVNSEEDNPGVKEKRAENSNTDGDISSIREKVGLSPEREISEEALSEIKFISDATGMTDLFEEIDEKESRERDWNYGSEDTLIEIVKGPNQKFLGIAKTEENSENNQGGEGDG